MSAVSQVATNMSKQFLAFSLAGDAFCVDILQVNEIRGYEQVRIIPGAPPYVKGVLNLRGSIVPIIDMRQRFDLPAVNYSATTVVILLSIETGKSSQVMGIVVDAVSDVLSIESDEIKVSPNLGPKINTNFIRGMVVRDNQMVMMLDANQLLDPEQFENLLAESLSFDAQ